MITVSLHGKTALVTGGASKLGTAIVTSLADAGAHVALTYVSHEVPARTLAGSLGGISIHADTTNRGHCAHAVRKAVKALGKIDILVNNAGAWKSAAFDAMSDADMDALVDINLRGTMNMCKAVIPHMKKNKDGAIINLATSSRNLLQKGNVAYAAGKAGVIGFTRALARELGPFGIRVNAVSPGWMPGDAEYARMIADAGAQTPVIARPVGSSRHIADAVLFFSSPLSEYVTGEILNVHGAGS